jgi:hypothetical protein
MDAHMTATPVRTESRRAPVRSNRSARMLVVDMQNNFAGR